MRRRLLEFLAVVAAFTALTMVVLNPLPLHMSSLIYSPENGDGQFSIWNVAWVARSLLFDPRHLFDANIFYPHRWTLAYSEMNLAAGAIGAVAYLGTRSAYAAHNFALVCSFILSGTVMYYLCRDISGDRRASAPSAVAFAFCPYLFGHLPHIQLLMTAGIPLSLLAFHRLLLDPRPARGVWLGLAMTAQAYGCGYYSVFILLVIGFAVVFMALRGRARDVRYWKAIAVAAAVAVIASAPLIASSVFLQRSGFERTLEGSRQHSADWRAYLASGSQLHAWLLAYLGHWNELLFPGFLSVIFGVVGVLVGWRAGGRRREAVLLYGILGVAAAWASFGPVAGLYSVLYRLIPTFSLLRAPSRFGLVVSFALAVLASIGIASLLERLDAVDAKRRAALQPTLHLPSLISVLIISAAIAEAMIPLKFDPALQPHSAYRLLATLPYGPVVELPIYSRRAAFRRARYMLDSTVHWKPLVDAYSDHIPPEFDDRAELLADFPSGPAFADLKRDKVRYAVIHLSAYEGQMRKDLESRIHEFSPYLRRLAGDSNLMLFEIVRYPG
jgi:hypothetical protein